VLAVKHEPPKFLGKPVVAVFSCDQFLLAKFIPVLPTDIPKMLEEIVDHLTEFYVGPWTILLRAHGTLQIQDVWYHAS
jgi:hypothetical protein